MLGPVTPVAERAFVEHPGAGVVAREGRAPKPGRSSLEAPDVDALGGDPQPIARLGTTDRLLGPGRGRAERDP
jgi:hypothetical protein